MLDAAERIGVMVTKKPSLPDPHDSWELSAREVLVPLLRPGEPLRMALSGATGWLEGLSFVDLVLGFPLWALEVVSRRRS